MCGSAAACRGPLGVAMVLEELRAARPLLVLLLATGCGGGAAAPTPAPDPLAPHLLGGTVSGLTGSGLVLLVNGGAPLVISANGPFHFPDALAPSSPYAVTVRDQPTAPNQLCQVTAGVGTMGSSDVTGVQIACSSPSILTSGLYARSAGTGRSDACALLPSDAALTGSPAEVVVAGNALSLRPPDFSTAPYLSVSLDGLISGATFHATSSEVFDVSTLPGASGYNCFLQVSRDVAGTITGYGQAQATDRIDVSVASGTDCAAAWAAYEAMVQGTGTLPCSSTVSFGLTRTGDLPPPPAWRIDSASGTGATLATLSTPTGTITPTGTGSLKGVFETALIDSAGSTACVWASFQNVYAIIYNDGAYEVQASFTPAGWQTGPRAVGPDVSLMMIRLADQATAHATTGSITLLSAPTTPDIPASTCAFSITGPLDLTFP